MWLRANVLIILIPNSLCIYFYVLSYVSSQVIVRITESIYTVSGPQWLYCWHDSGSSWDSIGVIAIFPLCLHHRRNVLWTKLGWLIYPLPGLTYSLSVFSGINYVLHIFKAGVCSNLNSVNRSKSIGSSSNCMNWKSTVIWDLAIDGGRRKAGVISSCSACVPQEGRRES